LKPFTNTSLVEFGRLSEVALRVPPMAIAALDLGARRIGIAVTDAHGLSAHPLRTIERRSFAADLEAIREVLGSRDIQCLVVGLPVNMDGSEGPMARHARNFAAKLAEAWRIEVKLQDERLSSFEAEDRLANSMSRGKKKPAIDAVAAAVILESYLELHALGPCKN
jgi:putative holliday junction resolvase